MTPSAPKEARRYVGQSVARRDGAGKVTGHAQYVDDIRTPGALHAKTVRSTIASGRIRSIDYLPGVPWGEFTIVTADDIPGENIVHLIEHDQPVLCDGVVRHHEEPILLLAHPDKGLVEKAARLVRVNYEPEPGVFDIGAGRVFKDYLIEHGPDLEAAFAACDAIVEGVYRTGAQEHVYIEPNGIIAWWKGGDLTVRGSLQCPYYVHKALKGAFGLPDDSWVNVIQDVTGGGFGGKEEFPSILALHAALLSRKAGGRPVRLIYDREEDMASSTKRHPSESHIRIGATRDGILRALDFDFRIDGGAYVTLSPVVLSRGTLHASGVYRWPSARIRGRAFFTNSPPYGAFRGFGAPQSIFAIELAVSQLADKLGIDPAELRRRNFLRLGDTMPTGQVLREEPNLEPMMDRALATSGYHARRAASPPGSMHAVGLSTFMHGAGFTGSGEVYLASRAALQTRNDGRVAILTSVIEMGQGTETIFPQIVAEVLGVPITDVVFQQPETRKVPNSGPTVASRTTMVVGRLIQRSAERLREILGGRPVADHFAENGPTTVEVSYEAPEWILWNDRTFRGDAYQTYAYSCNVAEVTVDPVTMAVHVDRITATVDIGTVINPVLAAGQVEGGIAQGVGWAVLENAVLREGVMRNTQMTNYILPTTVDMPEVTVEFMPQPYERGAFGAKGVGELPMDGPAPAIIHAIEHATGARTNKAPTMPEDIMAARRHAPK